MTTFLRELILKDIWLKLFSLGMATLIWFTINIAIQNQVSPVPSLPLGNIARRTFENVPVMVMTSAEDTRSFRVNPQQVDVTVEGESRVIKSLYSRDIRVVVDLTGIEAAHDMRTRIEISTPAGVTRATASPEEVQVIFPTKNG